MNAMIEKIKMTSGSDKILVRLYIKKENKKIDHKHINIFWSEGSVYRNHHHCQKPTCNSKSALCLKIAVTVAAIENA